MPKYSEKKILNYSNEQIFDLVSDVESYPDFLPWCVDCKIISKTENGFNANLSIGFNLLRESFISEVRLSKPGSIIVKYKDGPFKYLTNTWSFESFQNNNKTQVDFYIDFEFKSILLERLLGIWFEEAVKKMIFAFEERADELYG